MYVRRLHHSSRGFSFCTHKLSCFALMQSSGFFFNKQPITWYWHDWIDGFVFGFGRITEKCIFHVITAAIGHSRSWSLFILTRLSFIFKYYWHVWVDDFGFGSGRTSEKRILSSSWSCFTRTPLSLGQCSVMSRGCPEEVFYKLNLFDLNYKRLWGAI